MDVLQLSIDELREELEEERMAREKERLELVETIAQLKKRLLIHEDRAHDLSKTSGRSMDPQLEEERETNNRLRNVSLFAVFDSLFGIGKSHSFFSHLTLCGETIFDKIPDELIEKGKLLFVGV